jgi:hypothetical protein
MVNESVDCGQGHRGVDEDAAPLREWRVGRDSDAFSLVSFSDELEEHRGFGLIAAHVTLIVDLCWTQHNSTYVEQSVMLS